MTARSSRWMWLVCAVGAIGGATIWACDQKKSDGGGMTTTNATTSTASATASASATTAATAKGDDDDNTAGVPSSSASAATSAVASTSATASAKSTATGATANNAPAPGSCGGKDQPKCPLQAWMAANMQPAMAGGDATKLAAALRQAAKFAPPGYGDWAKIATDGAAAVDAAKDVTAGKPSCKGCHGEYQKRYRSEMRERPI